MGADWRQQEENEQERYEEERALLDSDPAYLAWLDMMDLRIEER